MAPGGRRRARPRQGRGGDRAGPRGAEAANGGGWNWSSSTSPRSPACAPAPMRWSPPESRSTWSSPMPASWPPRRARPRTVSRPSSAPTISAISCSSTASRRCCRPGARLVNLSSSGHRFSDVDLDDPNFEHTPYTEFGRLWPLQDRQHPVRRRVRPPPQGRPASARPRVHPGGIQTELGRHMTPEAMQATDRLDQRQPAAAGAAGLQMEDDPARRRDDGVGGRRRAGR